MRSFLTMLGVIIGIASVVSMVAVGEGAKSKVEQVFASMGTNMLIVLSGSASGGGVMGGFGSMPTLTWEDLEAIRTEAGAVRVAAPVTSTRAAMASNTATWTTQITGTTPEMFDIRAWSIAHGSLFGPDELAASSKVIVLGQTVSAALFGSGVDPLGRTVRFRGVGFHVIGVLSRKGQSPMGQDMDDAAFIPLSTFQTKIQGGLQKFVPGAIAVSAVSAGDTKRAERQITALLRERHHLAAGDEADFSIRNLTEIASAQEQGTRTLTALLAAIAVVSLVVGGIGIMNIMLVGVAERTREIGVRMAVGAKPWNILLQFLVEALALSALGGVLGLAVGVGAATALARSFGWAFTMRVDTALLAFAFSALVGVGFGIYPARRASRLDPIEALRAD